MLHLEFNIVLPCSPLARLLDVYVLKSTVAQNLGINLEANNLGPVREVVKLRVWGENRGPCILVLGVGTNHSCWEK